MLKLQSILGGRPFCHQAEAVISYGKHLTWMLLDPPYQGLEVNELPVSGCHVLGTANRCTLRNFIQRKGISVYRDARNAIRLGPTNKAS